MESSFQLMIAYDMIYYVKLTALSIKTSANPRLLRHGESCDYMLSSFKHRNKNKIQKSIS